MRYHVAVVGLVALALVIAPSLMRLAVATTAETVWTSIGPAGEYVQALAIDPQRPTTLFAGTRDHGVYKSTDGGRSWQAVNSGLNNLSVSALVVDSRNPTTIYAGIGQVSTNTGGAFKSTDGGGSWREINNGLTNTNLTIYALAVDPRTPTTLYAGTWGGVLKSTDAGGTWRAMNTGLDATGLKSNLDPAYANLTERFVFALAIDPRTPTTIYAVTSFGLGHEVHGVFKSTDGARNWRVLSTDLAGLSLVGLAIDPQTPTTLYARSKESGVFKSTDGGESWRGINNGLADLRVNALAIDHRTPTTPYAGTSHGVFESTDGGGNWRAANDGLTDLSAVVLAITPDTPTTLYAGTWGSGVFVSGSVPGIRASPTPQAGPPAETGAVTYLSVAEDGSVWLAIEIRGDLPLYAGSRKTILYRTSSSGERWEKAVEISGHGAIKRLWLFGSGRVSALLDDVIIHTADGGIRWRSSPAFGQG